jgi:predicted component of type VI protein secretion system
MNKKVRLTIMAFCVVVAVLLMHKGCESNKESKEPKTDSTTMVKPDTTKTDSTK